MPRPRHAAPRAVVLALLALSLVLGACTTTTAYFGAPSAELHGKRILLLRPSLISPTPEVLEKHVEQRLVGGMEALPELGPIVKPGQVDALTASKLSLRRDYNEYSNTLSLTGISDPDLARKLGHGLRVDLLAIAQPTFIRCDPSTCKGGDELWLVGSVYQAQSGSLAFRAHISAPAPADDPKALQALADSLTHDYLEQLQLAFRLHAHRERFTHLKALAGHKASPG